MMEPGSRSDRLLPVGRTLRMIAGVWLVLEGLQGVWDTTTGARVVATFVFLGALAFYGALQLVVSRRFERVNAWLGAALAVIPLAIVFLLGGPGGQLGAILFLGISLLVSAARADPGCEVTAISGAILGRRTHLVCLVFSPFDRVEERLARRRRA